MEQRAVKYLDREVEVQLPEYAPAGMPPVIDYDCPADTYHADRSSVNAGSLDAMKESPRTYLAQKVDPDGDKDYFRFGRAAHYALLEPLKFKDLYQAVPDFGPMQSSKNRAIRDEWIASLPQGAIYLKADEMSALTGMLNSVLEHKVARNMLKNGRPEVSVWARCPQTGLKCRVRPDYLVFDADGSYHLMDFKTAQSSWPGIFAKKAIDLNYHIRMAFYVDLLTVAYGKPPTTANFIVTEKSAPYETAVFTLGEDFIEYGRMWKRYLMSRLDECLKSGVFPARQTEAETLVLPSSANYNLPPEPNEGA